MRIRKNDIVQVISGDDSGKTGKVLRVVPQDGRLLVEGVNLVWKHMRKSQQHPKGARIQKESYIDISNARLICQNCNKPTGVTTKMLDTGEKVRICKKCNEAVKPEEAIK
ncbi:MAG: 50S ribosomal protein L24 [Planctomycetes bacterium RBG_16_43_13]|nr:MAG: 50S ribosomal protein L24 [Planctomycetes bacterium RBG_16_43_13]